MAKVHTRNNPTFMGAGLVALLSCIACGLTLPGDEDTGQETGGSTGTTPAETTSPEADTEDGGSSSTGGEDDSTGEPEGDCDGGCDDDELCWAGSCHPMGMSQTFGGLTARQTARAVATYADGSIVVVGEFTYGFEVGGMLIEPDNSSGHLFVVKLDPIGDLVWVRTFGAAGDEDGSQSAKAVAIDGDGNVIVGGDMQGVVDFGVGPVDSGGTDDDVVVVKLDADGNTLWARAFGDGGYQRLEALAVAPDGSINLTGHFNDTLDFGGDPLVNLEGASDVFIARLDADGNHAWSLSSGAANAQLGRALAVDADGNVLVCGDFVGQLNFGGSDLASEQVDAFVVKLGPDGTEQWSIANGDFGDDRCDAIGVDPNGNVAIQGRFHDELSFGDSDPGLDTDSSGFGDMYAAKLDPDGVLLWSRGFGAGENDVETTDPGNLAVDLDGNIVLGGPIAARIDFGGGPLEPEGTSVYLARLGPDGEHLQSALFGDADRQVGTAVATDAFGNALIVGEFAGTIDFGFGLHATQGSSPDAFLARIP